MNGVDLVSVKELLGHRDIQTTYRYSHLSPEHLKDAINRGSLKPNRDQNRDQKEAKGEKESQVIESVVRPTGLEPVTPRSVVWCSIH